MRKSVTTGLFACTLIFSGVLSIGKASAQEQIITNKEKSVVELLSMDQEDNLTLAVLTGATADKVDEVQQPEVVKHIVVKGENLSDIAKQYNVDWKRIFDKNPNLNDPDVIEVGLELVIPAVDEQLVPRDLPAPQPVVAEVVKPKIEAPKTAANVSVSRGSSSGNGYVAGYCTWYVKNRRPDLPNNLGNASSWVSRASSQGLSTGSTPAVGAVGQRGNHVVYVESVNDDGTITITDMNHEALYEITTRVVSASDFRYIY